MKTKKFIEKVEGLDFVGRAERGLAGLIGFPNREGSALINVNENILYCINTDYMSFRELQEEEKRQLIDIVWEYAKTSLEEREEEKKYLYRFPFIGSPNHYICKNSFDVLKIDSPFRSEYLSDVNYHFTDKEVEQYTGKDRALFDACEKIEVINEEGVEW